MVWIMVLMLGSTCPGWSQRPDTLARNVLTVGLEYGIQWPGGTLSERFGQHFSLGSSIQLTSLRKPYFLGAFGYFHFGNQVREDVLSLFRTGDGGFINPAQEFVQVYLRQRGFQAGVEAGTSWRWQGKKGLWLLQPGVQCIWLSHHIRIQDESESLPSIARPYRDGYDRLTSGPGWGPVIHWMYLQSDKLVNIRLDLYANLAYTQLRRDRQYDGYKPEGARRDWIYGIRLAWLFPIYRGIAVEDIYF